MPVRVLKRRRIRVVGHWAHMARARHRRGLRQPRRITDRAEVHRSSADMVADRLQPLQYRLPLFPIKLLQKRTQTLDERILEQRFAIRFRDEEAVQSDVQRLGDFSSVW